jgi:S-adenosylmethionine-diacylgycerolhomoserine-N-methlytransferase
MSDSTFEKMDRMYGLQRHFYDFTRKYYLLGRDQLLRAMNVKAGDTVLEVGCGTGRNLVILAKRHPDARFFGLDASEAMLEMADAKIDTARLRNITLANELADNFYYVNTFEMMDRFDKIFFSYSISMIPTWRESIDNALNNLKVGGELWMLQNWLKAFHVQFWNDLIPYLGTLETKGLVRLKVTPIHKRYAFIARLEKV